jgi:pyruvate dehydrogenase E2 component (dihydrolipoamide acetyltransferase)
MKTVDMPKMGDTMEEGKILRWLKHEGDTVKKGEPVAEVETDKVNIEIEAFTSGVLRKILVHEGDSAPIGASIALVGAADEPLPGGQTDAGSTAVQAVTPPAQFGNAGVERATTAPQSVPVNGATGGTTQGTSQTTTASEPVETIATTRTFISPIARRIAEEHQIDYKKIRGTGPNGRILKMDVEAALATRPAQPARAVTSPTLPYPETYVEPQPETLPISPATRTPEPVEPVAVGGQTTATTGETVEIPLTAMRRTIAKRLSQSMQTAPHFYVTSVIDTGKLAQLRQEINEYAAKDPAPLKVSFNDLIVKAVARTLASMPEVNVSFAEDRLIQKKQVNVGVAVALEQGLIVPVIRNADQRTILDLTRETRRLAEAARQGRLRPEDFSGGTFTVSNLGMYNVDSFTAVINPPESAILAVGSITPTPVVEDGQVVVRDRMKVTLSSDHRAIDGAIAARFLQAVKRVLEEPFGLLL